MNLFTYLDANPEPVPFAGARTTDPATSHLAADAVELREGPDLRRFGTRSQKYPLLKAYAAVGDATDAEAAQIAGLRREGVCWWKRCSELRQAGFIVVVGQRVRPETDKLVDACRITPEGLDKLTELLRGHA